MYEECSHIHVPLVGGQLGCSFLCRSVIPIVMIQTGANYHDVVSLIGHLSRTIIPLKIWCTLGHAIIKQSDLVNIPHLLR